MLRKTKRFKNVTEPPGAEALLIQGGGHRRDSNEANLGPGDGAGPPHLDEELDLGSLCHLWARRRSSGVHLSLTMVALSQPQTFTAACLRLSFTSQTSTAGSAGSAPPAQPPPAPVSCQRCSNGYGLEKGIRPATTTTTIFFFFFFIRTIKSELNQ